jgi:hypothetical protein
MKGLKLVLTAASVAYFAFGGVLFIGKKETSDKIEDYLDDNLKEGKLKDSLQKAVDYCKDINDKVINKLNQEAGE